MPVTELKVPCGDGRGFDFGEFFHDPDLVQKTLEQFAVRVHPAICYCLEFHSIPDTTSSFFAPYSLVAKKNGLSTLPGIALPPSIPYQHLVSVQPGSYDHWPLLGQWWPHPNRPSLHPQQLDQALFHGVVRLQSGPVYVGYFKAVWLDPPQSPMSFEAKLCDAYSQTQAWLDCEVPKWRWDKRTLNPAAQQCVQGLRNLVETCIQAKEFERALQIVSVLLTSHLGAAMNRVVCLAPRDGELHCVYAHGGDCSSDFSDRIQRSFAATVPTLDDLHRCLASCPLPVDDCLYRELTAGPKALSLEHRANPNSCVSQLSRASGDLSSWLGTEFAIETLPGVDVNLSLGVVSDTDPRVIAVKLTPDDPWLSGYRRASKQAWLENRNSNWYTLPWVYRKRLLALIILDLGYWHSPDLRRDVLPRLIVAEAILNDFASYFIGADFADWLRNRPAPSP